VKQIIQLTQDKLAAITEQELDAILRRNMIKNLQSQGQLSVIKLKNTYRQNHPMMTASHPWPLCVKVSDLVNFDDKRQIP
jgi:hypothetical protein